MENKELKKISFDVSTTACGVVYQIGNSTEGMKAHVFEQSSKDIKERIKNIFLEVREWIKDKEFDIIIVSKASHANVNPDICTLEGLILSLAFVAGKEYDYMPDVTWYTMVGDKRDERPTKKLNSVKRFIQRTGIPEGAYTLEYKYNGSKLDKITIVLTSGRRITDDIADAFNAGDLYENRLVKEGMKWQQSDTQDEINKLRSANKKLRIKIENLNVEMKKFAAQMKQYDEQYKASGSKVALNALNKRRDSIEKIKGDIVIINMNIDENESKVKKLMADKNNLSEDIKNIV